jgi:hypothetical protein
VLRAPRPRPKCMHRKLCTLRATDISDSGVGAATASHSLVQQPGQVNPSALEAQRVLFQRSHAAHGGGGHPHR